MSRVLITGGAGFIGLHLARRLADQGDEVILVDNFERAVVDRELNDLARHPLCRIERQDLSRDPLPAVDPDAIVHLAAIVGVRNVVAQPAHVLKSNVAALTMVLEQAKAMPSLRQFVFTSTSEVYSGSVRLGRALIPTPEDIPLTIIDPGDPRGTYLLSKIYGEALCLMSELPVTIVRPHNVYGPRMGLSHVIPELLFRAWSAESGGTLEVSSVDHTRSFCYIDDAVTYLAALVTTEGAGHTYNLGRQDPEVTIGEVAQTVVDVVGKPLSITPLPATPGSPTRRAPDMSSLIAFTGLLPHIDLKTGVARTYEWYQKHVFSGAEVSAR